MCGDTQIKASELRAALHALKRQTQSGETGFERQFRVSCVSIEHSQVCCTCAHVEFCAVSDTRES